LLLTAAGWQSTHAEDNLKPELLSCSKLGDDLERLSCFDRVAQLALSPAPSKNAPLATTPPQMFGLRPQSASTVSPEIQQRSALKFISAHVTLLQEGQLRLLMELDNGQKWKQLGTEDLLLRVGDHVKISRGAFDSFILMTDGNRITHVKRVE